MGGTYDPSKTPKRKVTKIIGGPEIDNNEELIIKFRRLKTPKPYTKNNHGYVGGSDNPDSEYY